MALPNPSMSFSPFAILTAEEMNDIVENIESLSAGTGFGTGVIDGSVVLQDNSVTSAKINYSSLTARNSTDANGYEISDFGAFKLASKRLQINGLTVSTSGTTIATSQSIPVGLTNHSSAKNFQYSYKATVFAGQLTVVMENADNATTMTFTGRSIDSSRAYDIDIWLLFII